MVVLLSFGMPFEIRAIQHLNNFRPFEIGTCSVFELPIQHDVGNFQTPNPSLTPLRPKASALGLNVKDNPPPPPSLLEIALYNLSTASKVCLLIDPILSKLSQHDIVPLKLI